MPAHIKTPDQELVNLTAADTCVIFHSDWNPQNDLQAQAQCHRFGQSKAVKVYRLITRNYEREMLDKARLKLGLDRAVLQSMRGNNNGLRKRKSVIFLDAKSFLAGPAVLQEGDRGPAEESSLRRHHGRERRRQPLLLGGHRPDPAAKSHHQHHHQFASSSGCTRKTWKTKKCWPDWQRSEDT
ncbi:hypothetical protein CgunFtcFv8_009388 [Champsocephalus gunnari]|uniref:Uncharacterized protein n=1 Tax=Champsocephalus gunnari TaxID=52237 RepID=A0AAN8C258_CHAGU|nr:hypothetical protein CgunFtcFv8_009388 [Champsocephalus gunnari]